MYRIRMAGHLDDHWSNWFNGLALHHDGDGTTTLTGPIEDQAQLHGLLARVRDLGITLISVHALTELGQEPRPVLTRPDPADKDTVWPYTPDEPSAADAPDDQPRSDP